MFFNPHHFSIVNKRKFAEISPKTSKKANKKADNNVLSAKFINGTLVATQTMVNIS